MAIINPKSRKRNYYREGLVCTCDECGKVPPDKILWTDKYKNLWCLKCWEIK